MVDTRIETRRNISAMCLTVAAICGIGGGILALVAWDVGWLAVGIVIGICVVLWLVLTETNHTRDIEKTQITHAHEIEKIKANPQPIDAAYRIGPATTNWQAPVTAKLPEPQWTTLIQGENKKQMVRYRWSYGLNDGTEARGDLIEGIVAGAFDGHDQTIDIRDHIRRKYRIEFGNASYSRAIRALQESGAIDRNGNWLVQTDSVDALLSRMRDGCDIEEAD